ncbi:arylsulfatase [Polaribacter sp. R2A056_3_33]|uniref:sulfatase family protein n=1 Tax=Polaribacter sp. R2A056_3_33 TaxID=2745563 RepID=UPI001C4F2E35|nr:arylsulfatase [Polaribacter sp. R2A056_3_33]QXP71070.1 arylsulfatase [Polaribacter sp. R2A056_3_33]
MKSILTQIFQIRFLLLTVLLITTNCASSQTSKKEDQKKPNIIYILADDLGIGDVSLYNEKSKIQTPNLDKMGKEGMQFTDAHTSSAVCTPTRYGILTGRYNWRTPLKEFVTWGNSPSLIQKNRLTVAQLLKDNGYKTASIGKWHLGLNWTMKNDSPEFDHFSDKSERLNFKNIDYSKPLKFGPNDMGFDYSYMISASLNMPPFVYIENNKATMIPTKITERSRKKYPFSSWIKGDVADDFKHEEVLPNVVNKSISFIKENANKEKPFFMYIPLPSPHNPVLPIAPWKGQSEIGSPYADFVIMIDDLMGTIFKTLKEQGIDENTIVIFTSDNGYATTNDLKTLKQQKHSPSYIYSGYKGSFLEGGHRVPFLVKWPGKIKPNSVSDATICTTDFMATCADIINYDFKDNEAEDSYSMLPLLTNEGDYLRDATIHHDKYGVFAIRKGDWKLIVSPNSGISASGETKKHKDILADEILYNLKTDIKERNNVAGQFPEKVKELKELLSQQIRNGRSTPGKKQDNDAITGEWPQANFALKK